MNRLRPCPPMASARTAWSLGLAAGQTVALVGTFFWNALGTVWWHHLVSLGLVLAATVAVRHRMTDRRFLGIGVLVTAILATVSGFYLLYWKEGIRVDGYQDWGVWWHVAWSWGAAVFFWQHTWVNRVAYGHFLQRSFRALAPTALHIGLYALAVVGFIITGGPGKTWFTSESYIPISLWTWIIVAGTAYLAWWLLRRRPHAAQTRIRGRVDLALVPVAAVAVISGIPLLWFDGAMEAAGLKYASKVWHVLPSTLFAVLVFVHAAQLWSTVRMHWRRMGAARLDA